MKLELLSSMIKESKKVMVLTGAGISTDSGIPDFRSKNSGLWEKIDPMEALLSSVLYKNPEKFYNEGFKMLIGMNDVKPNDGHIVLKKLEELGYIKGIITQNIDGLHSMAGSKIVYEVHGNTRLAYCETCYREYPIKDLEILIKNGQIPPKCNKCNGIIRPSVVLFGDMLPNDFLKAEKELSNTDLLIIIGTSLSVSPVNYLPNLVNKYVIINKTETMMDYNASLVIRGNSSKVLKELLNKLEEGD